jgi:hypothetical protein
MKQQPPERETRQSIERDLAEQRRKRRLVKDGKHRAAALVQHLAKLRDVLDPEAFAKVQSQFLRGTHALYVEMLKKRRRPGDGSMPALVEPPRAPKPKSGGAAAALEFD